MIFFRSQLALFLLPLQLLSSLPHVLANTEKAIFVAPPQLNHNIPVASRTFEHLCLERLNPQKPKLQKRLPVQFPNDDEPKGLQSWYLLKGLLPGRRYEVRVCWSATQPTAFHLSTFTPEDIFHTDGLMTKLNAYAVHQQGPPCAVSPDPPNLRPDAHTSLLFLQVHAAADFYSSNSTLMSNPPNVLVDIILDPYIFNILPRSLASTGAYAIFIGILGYFLSGKIYSWLYTVANNPTKKSKET